MADGAVRNGLFDCEGSTAFDQCGSPDGLLSLGQSAEIGGRRWLQHLDFICYSSASIFGRGERPARPSGAAS